MLFRSDTFPRFPSFTLDSNRLVEKMLNPFLVVLNAEIKFRRYLRFSQPQAPLPSDVMELVTKTLQLVDLIYWEPFIRGDTTVALDLTDQEEGELAERLGESNYGYGRDPPGEGATLAERREYNQYLISGRGKPDPYRMIATAHHG